MISPDGMESSFRGLTMFVINFGVESLEQSVWFMFFVKTSSLRCVGIRKVGREYFYHLEVNACFVYCSFTYNAHSHS